MIFFAHFALLPLAAGIVVHPPVQETAESTPVVSRFDDFIAKYHKSYVKGSPEYMKRFELFTQRLQQAELLNSAPRAWKAGTSPLADYTAEELQQIKGWKGIASRPHGNLRSQVSLLTTDLPEEWLKWKDLATLQEVFNQANCGSCWAVTSATVLNTHREIHHNITDGRLSAQELVACVPNPSNCGGQGGCQGATVELAMSYTMQNGLASEEAHPYVGSDQECSDRSVSSFMQLVSDDDLGMAGVRTAVAQDKGLHSLKMHGWEKLPVNKYLPLMQALVTKGPVAVSVSADNWELYMSGIYGDCSKDAVVNHAVTLIAYGKDKELQQKYWTIMNSWGAMFGEQGTMRLLRQDHEENFCGVDHQPELGTGCDGGPSAVRVCGMCGILYDNVVPIF
eukprot:Skav201397  [mRNA]  locus=scaffold296:345072:346401:+ [translate_table: standard]